MHVCMVPSWSCMMIGIFLVIFGSLLLLDRIGWINIHMGQYILPIFLIALGGSMISRKSKRDKKPVHLHH